MKDPYSSSPMQKNLLHDRAFLFGWVLVRMPEPSYPVNGFEFDPFLPRLLREVLLHFLDQFLVNII